MLKMTLPDGSIREVEKGTTVLDFGKRDFGRLGTSLCWSKSEW